MKPRKEGTKNSCFVDGAWRRYDRYSTFRLPACLEQNQGVAYIGSGVRYTYGEGTVTCETPRYFYRYVDTASKVVQFNPFDMKGHPLLPN